MNVKQLREFINREVVNDSSKIYVEDIQSQETYSIKNIMFVVVDVGDDQEQISEEQIHLQLRYH